MFSIIITMFLFSAMLFVPLSENANKRMFESNDENIIEKLQQKIIDVVVDAYQDANDSVIKGIDQHFKKETRGYDNSYITIINPMENMEVMETEIYKVYAMFSVYKDRELAIKSAKNPKMTIQDESDIYDVKGLKKMIATKWGQPCALLRSTYSISTWSYQPTTIDEETGKVIDDTTKAPVTSIHITYRVEIRNIDEVGPEIFGLQDLTNSQDPNIPDGVKINEIELAYKKAESMDGLFNGTLSESGDLEMYGIGMDGKMTFASKTDYTSFIEDYKVENVNFNPNEKISVPLGGTFKISSVFGPRIHPTKKVRKFHTGLDLGAAEGTPIYSVANGVVVDKYRSDGYGNHVVVYHGEIGKTHYFTTYSHMLHPANVAIGDKVYNNTVIGVVGSTGVSTGNHLHIEIRISVTNTDGYTFAFKDPEIYLDTGYYRAD